MVSFGRSMWHLGFVWGFKGIERYVLGLLSSKTTDLDDEERVLELLEKASQILPKERLFLSHQCGFVSCNSGNELATPQQWAQIKQGQDIAKKFFG